MRLHVFYILTFFLLAQSVFLLGQNQRIEDLEGQLLTTGRDTQRVNILVELALEYRRVDPKKVYELTQEALTLSQEIGYKRGEAQSYNRLGSYYRQTGRYAKAVDYYLKALTYYQETNDSVGLSFCYNGLGILFRLEQLFDKALYYHEKSLRIAEARRDSVGIAIYLKNIGVCYYELERYNLSLDYSIESLRIAEAIEDKSIIPSSLHVIGDNYLMLGEVKKAIQYHEKALSISRETSNLYSEVYSLNRLAECYIKLDRFELASQFFQKSLSLSFEHRLLSEIKDTYQGLSRLNELQGNFRTAHEYYRLYSNYKDSLFNTESKRLITDLTQSYEFEQQKLEIELLTKDKQLNSIQIKRQRLISITLVLVFILSIGYVFLLTVSNKRKHRVNILLKQQNQEILKQKQEIEKQTIDLIEKNNEITAQRDKLTQLNAELHQKNEEIQTQRDYLIELNTELQTKNEEILAQRDELERAQNQLIQSEKMASLGVLTAGIAHEINNPINFVYAGVNILKRDFEDIEIILNEILKLSSDEFNREEVLVSIEEKLKDIDLNECYDAIKQTLDDIKLGARRTAEIVEGLRNFARTDKEDWATLDIHRIIDGVLLLLKNNYKNRIDIIKEYNGKDSIIQCKAGRLDQALLNLVSNAIDAIDEKGSIVISTFSQNSKLHISIKDSGKGISDEDITKIFDPFFTTKVVGKGLGLGLSITYGIIQEHNGTIKVNSKIGIGTEFIITLPIVQKVKS